MTEGEIRAAGEVARTQTLVQHIRHERLGRHQAEGVVERQFVEQDHPQRGHGVRPLRRQGQAEGRVVGAEHLARVRLEREERERRMGPCGMGGAQHGRVTEMHAVEIPQCHGRVTRVRGQFAPVAEDAHQSGAGTWTCASPSITTLPATAHVVLRVARRFAGSSAVTSTVAVTVSPIFTGPRKRRLWPM